MPTATPRSTCVAEFPRGVINSAVVMSNSFIRMYSQMHAGGQRQVLQLTPLTGLDGQQIDDSLLKLDYCYDPRSGRTMTPQCRFLSSP